MPHSKKPSGGKAPRAKWRTKVKKQALSAAKHAEADAIKVNEPTFTKPDPEPEPQKLGFFARLFS